MEPRLLLAVQKPTIAANTTSGDVVVSFMSGPQAFGGSYTIGCYDADEYATCSNYTDAIPIVAPVSGNLTKSVGRTDVEETFAVQGSVGDSVSCIIDVDGPFSRAGKCVELSTTFEGTRLAGSIIKPAVAATGNGTGEVTFSSIAAVEYSYDITCLDTDVLALSTNETVTCKSNFSDPAIVAAEQGITVTVPSSFAKLGKNTAFVDAAPSTNVTCFIFSEGPLEKADKCKATGTATLLESARLAGSIVKPTVTVTSNSTAQVSFDSIAAVKYSYDVKCLDTDILTGFNVTDVSCKSNFTEQAFVDAQVNVNVTAPSSYAKLGKNTVNVASFPGTPLDCYIFAEGPFGKFDKCKAAGNVTLPLSP